MNPTNADRIWVAYFGLLVTAIDAFGNEIHRWEHSTDSPYSWEADHIWPKHPGMPYRNGANVIDNLQPLSNNANRSKSNKMQGKINGKTFTVSKVSTSIDNRKIGRMSIFIDEGWVWAYDEPKFEFNKK